MLSMIIQMKLSEFLPQVNVLMHIDEKSRRILFYDKFNGSIPDVLTVASTCKTLLHLDTSSYLWLQWIEVTIAEAI